MEKIRNKLFIGNALEILPQFPSSFVDMCITSPPYYGLRDYKSKVSLWEADPKCVHNFEEVIHRGIKGGLKSEKVHIKGEENFQQTEDKAYMICTKCGGWLGQLGHEPTPDLFVKHLADIFDQVGRVLTPEGGCWVILGDTYWGGGQAQGHTKESTNFGIPTQDRSYMSSPIARGKGYPNKSLLMVPYRFVIEMVNRGWILRNDIIWQKPNAMPHPVKDRFTVDYEHIFFFVKQEKYFFEQAFEPLKESTIERSNYEWSKSETKGSEYRNINGLNRPTSFSEVINLIGRNKRCVWSIPTAASHDKHFAIFPRQLLKIPIECGSPSKICSKCGHVPRKIYEKIELAMPPFGGTKYPNKSDETYGTNTTIYSGNRKYFASKFIGITECGCKAQYDRGIVLDPFIGTGTTALEAISQGRDYLGIDISPDYLKMAIKNVKKVVGPIQSLASFI
jgi:site-specific DNA-methyltransferase (adenine-specific)